MDQQLTGPVGIVIGVATVTVRGDMGADQPQLSVVDPGIRLADRRLASPDRLDLRPRQGDAGLDRLVDEVVVEGAAIGRDHPVRPSLLRLLICPGSLLGCHSRTIGGHSAASQTRPGRKTDPRQAFLRPGSSHRPGVIKERHRSGSTCLLNCMAPRQARRKVMASPGTSGVVISDGTRRTRRGSGQTVFLGQASGSRP